MNVIPVLAGPLFLSVPTMSEIGWPCLPEKTIENVMIPHTRLPIRKSKVNADGKLTYK